MRIPGIAGQAVDPASLGPRFARQRAFAQRLIAWTCAAAIPANAAAALLVGNGTVLPVLLAATLLAALALLSLRGTGVQARITVSLALIGQCIVMNVAMMGHPMQADSHMLYFAALAAIATLGSRHALVAAVVLIALHHVATGLAWPALTFLSADPLFNMFRSGYHGAAVALAAASLLLIVRFRLIQTLFSERRAAQLEEAMREVRQALDEAERRKREAEGATRQAEEATAAATEARERAEAALREAEENARAAHAAEAANTATQERHAREVEEVIAHLQEKLSDLAGGDLTTRIERPLPPAFAELSQSFNLGVARLEEAMAAVQDEVVSIRRQSAEINGAAEDLGRRSEAQVGTLSDTAATLQELTRLIRTIEGDTHAARDAGTETLDKASSGGEVMDRTAAAMDQIEGSSSEIRKVTGVIDDIAFQTNLLALNAGVEAARAGEAGRGFAVVANEVRALAQRSSEAAKEIEGLIRNSAGHVGRGVELVKSTGSALGEIRGAVERTADRMEAVSEATADQTRALADVNSAISELEAITQQNAGIFRETLSANALLSKTAEGLAERVGQFRIDTAQAPGQSRSQAPSRSPAPATRRAV